MEMYRDDDSLSTLLEITSYDTHGFGQGFALRRSRHDVEANSGSQEARQDWIRYIGPVEEFGGCNPFDGNFTSLVLPLCRPERIGLVAYIHEYAFLYDNVLESAAKSTLSKTSNDLVIEETKSTTVQSIVGMKQIQAKMILRLNEIDETCAQRVLDVWKTMVSTTAKRDKTQSFASLEAYVKYRVVDTGAPFVESLMLWGMGMTLTSEEDAQLESVVFPCFAALGLTNDYFSFDREWVEFQESPNATMTNAVWLLMQLEDTDIRTAKAMVRVKTSEYARQFQRRRSEFLNSQHTPVEKLSRYLHALSFLVSGNLIWSLQCPRYHAENRYDPNACRENDVECRQVLGSYTDPTVVLRKMQISTERRDSESSTIRTSAREPWKPRPSVADSGERGSSYSISDDSGSAMQDSPASSAPSTSSEIDDTTEKPTLGSPDEILDPRHVNGPYDYIKSLPSKDVRNAFIEAIGVWVDVSEADTTTMKEAISRLHNASLMLDDIEDGSDLRRGKPAVHTVYGVPLTINSANYQIIQALDDIRKLENPQSIEIFVEEMRNLHVGQSYDLHWTQGGICPSEEEYIEMIDKKTGGLFRLLARLMLANSTRCGGDLSLDHLITLAGRYFQIRDDYQNLTSPSYTSQKGLCEDLDEGKISYPMMHALSAKPTNLQLQAIMQQKKRGATLSKSMKELVLEYIGQAESLSYTKQSLHRIYGQIDEEVGRLEQILGEPNWIMRLLFQKLRV